MDFLERVKKVLEKGVEVSKDIIGKAGHAAKDLGEKSMLHLEIRNLENDIKKKISAIGALVFEHLTVDGKASITAKNPDLAKILDEIKVIEEEINKREESLKKFKDEPDEIDKDSVESDE